MHQEEVKGIIYGYFSNSIIQYVSGRKSVNF